MEEKKERVFNHVYVFSLPLFLLILWANSPEGLYALPFFLLFFGLVFWTEPVCLTLGPEGVRITYLFGRYEAVSWDDLRKITFGSVRHPDVGFLHYIYFNPMQKNGRDFALKSRFRATKGARKRVLRHARAHGVPVLDYREKTWYEE